MKFFNTAGPVMSEDHYALDPLSRIDLEEMRMLIAQKKYFVLHAPRQTGKTSMLLALMDELNTSGQYNCLYINVESGQPARENVGAAMKSIIFELTDGLRAYLGDETLLKKRAENAEPFDQPFSGLRHALSLWAETSSKPTVLFIDEIDSLIGDTLVSVLRQLRTGYAMRPNRFPQSIILCGVRDVRDYRIHASSEKDPITGGSAFNVKAMSLRLGNFSFDETARLLVLHTEETGQIFEKGVAGAIFQATGGQPWLVNALAYELTYTMVENRDRSKPITLEMVNKAKEALIQRRDTHLDQLVHKLKEPRVHRVIAPILAGVDTSTELADEDMEYVRDLGLITMDKQARIANPIYQEVIPRMLTWPTQMTLSHKSRWYIDEDTGCINMHALLEAFQAFFQENSEHWIEKFQYKEAGPQLLLQAFLQRVINGGGRIEREYALGRGRTDLLVEMTLPLGVQRIVLELKLIKGSRASTIEKALPQITRYMDRCGTDEGHLVLFDRSEKPWSEKIFNVVTSHEIYSIQVWGM